MKAYHPADRFIYQFKDISKSLFINEMIDVDHYSDEEFDIIYNVAKKNEMHLMFLDKIVCNTNQELRKKVDYIRAGMIKEILSQKKRKKIFSSVVTLLRKSSIPFVVLKGNTIEMLYWNRDLRVASDIDVMVPLEFRYKAIKLFNKLGYYLDKDNSDENETVLLHKKYLPIELHHSLLKAKMFDNIRELEAEMFRKPQIVNDNESIYYVPSDEAHLVYMTLHLAKHIWSDVILFRQFLDVALFISGREIEWTAVEGMLKGIGAVESAGHIYELLRDVFELEIPILNSYAFDISSALEMAIFGVEIAGEDIYSDDELKYVKSLSRYMNGQRYYNRFSIIFSALFPPNSLMIKDYKYLKNYPLLLPLAWSHRLIVTMVSKPKRFFGLLKISKKTQLIKRHSQLLDDLNIHVKRGKNE